MPLIQLLLDSVLSIIGSFGYLGIFLLMLLESTVFPIPSELVLPFAGYLSAAGELNFFAVIIVATAGSLVGSLISYYIGKYLGKELILRYGKFVFLDKHSLELSHSWFEKFGAKIVFICRFIPAVRHVISIPAGIAEMQKRKFITYTVAGAFLWNSFLAYTGIILKENWQTLLQYSQILDILVIVGIIFGIIFYFWLHLRK
ncbi:MAG: DedA family protein [archaeon]|nr:DedA family protein [archaeon]